MTRQSNNQYDEQGFLVNGYDYENQCWVRNGYIEDCGHPAVGAQFLNATFTPPKMDKFKGCSCFGRLNRGIRSKYKKEFESLV